ncbi:MAG: class I SAM-dependent methyltransferase [Candidatus Omnitrophica bacterium]|nr:class I SAM-dependent methyltransferase [Candidatus Omnitrophota bacterium]
MNILKHYKKLWFFNFNRLKNNNYKLMREYFADLLIDDVEKFMVIKEKVVLDVGGARGEFCKVLSEKRNCLAYNLDPNPYEYGAYDDKFIWPQTKVGSAEQIPFDSNSVDLVVCRGVLEHIPTGKQQIALNEMFRVAKNGGWCYLAIPPWFNPTAGHGLKPFHYLPFSWAKAMAEIFYKKKIPACSWQEKRLFSITFSRMLAMIRSSGFELIATQDVHLKMHFLTKFPILREFMIPTVAFILKKNK